MALYPRIPLQTLILYEDSSILEGMYWPEEDTKEEFLDYFVLEYGEFTPIYQQPTLCKKHVAALGAALKPTIDKWYNVLQIEYAPLENYDRQEDSKDTRTPNLQTLSVRTPDLTRDGTRTPNLSENETLTHGKVETTSGGHTDSRLSHSTEHQVSADNTGTYFPAEKTLEDPDTTTRTYNSESVSESGSSGSVKTNTGTERNMEKESGTDTIKRNDTGTETNVHTARAHGNIGVTTSQQMLLAELDVSRFNLMDEVARLYAEKLLILIY